MQEKNQAIIRFLYAINVDIYLDCLDDNELDKFSCFKIKYNVKPTKKQK